MLVTDNDYPRIYAGMAEAAADDWRDMAYYVVMTAKSHPVFRQHRLSRPGSLSPYAALSGVASSEQGLLRHYINVMGPLSRIPLSAAEAREFIQQDSLLQRWHHEC